MIHRDKEEDLPMSLFSLDLLGEMERVRGEIDRILGEERLPAWTFPFSRISFLPGRASRGYPLINIGEDNDNVYVDALAPGVKGDTLNVSVTGDKLVISGEKFSLPGEVKPESIHRGERSAGEFVRTLSLPAPIEADKVEASYRNGLLRVVLPKADAARPRQIAVHVK
jgi:HSP20 family protein